MPCEGTDPAKDHMITRTEMQYNCKPKNAKECPGWLPPAGTLERQGVFPTDVPEAVAQPHLGFRLLASSIGRYYVLVVEVITM